MAKMTPRYWAGAFFVSVALNVLLAGIIASAYLNRDRDMAQRMTVYTVPWALRIVGEDVGVLARRIYVKYQAAMARDRQTLTQDYMSVNEILAAPQFNRAAFADSLAKLRGDIGIAQATMHEGMVEFAGGITPEQRRQLTAFIDEWSVKREQRAIRRDEMIEQKDRRNNKSD